MGAMDSRIFSWNAAMQRISLTSRAAARLGARRFLFRFRRSRTISFGITRFVLASGRMRMRMHKCQGIRNCKVHVKT